LAGTRLMSTRLRATATAPTAIAPTTRLPALLMTTPQQQHHHQQHQQAAALGTNYEFQPVSDYVLTNLMPFLDYMGEEGEQQHGAYNNQYPYHQPGDYLNAEDIHDTKGPGNIPVLMALIKEAVIRHETLGEWNKEQYTHFMLLLQEIYSRLGWHPSRWSPLPTEMTTPEDAAHNVETYQDRGLWATFETKYNVVHEFTEAMVNHFPHKREYITTQIEEQGLIMEIEPYRIVSINEVGNVLAKVLERMLGDKAIVLAAIEDDFAHIYRFALNDLQSDFDVQMAAGLKGLVVAATNALKSMIFKAGSRLERVKNFGKKLYGIDVAAEHEALLEKGLQIATAHPRDEAITELWQELEHLLTQPGWRTLASKLARKAIAEYEADDAEDEANAKRQRTSTLAFLEAHFGAEKVAKWQLHAHPWRDFAVC